ncbi:14813_t:CDS:2 [Dentiscutata heterogama]|uniref:14813_t:CDS:1 n=1 Tax=Dentiscutata heterogama TaxID=1316150 RepID=A0ACA9JY43_9GLOM|nr:14813_t:CDS:2 [Dentiscutata heterogama]
MKLSSKPEVYRQEISYYKLEIENCHQLNVSQEPSLVRNY